MLLDRGVVLNLRHCAICVKRGTVKHEIGELLTTITRLDLKDHKVVTTGSDLYSNVMAPPLCFQISYPTKSLQCVLN